MRPPRNPTASRLGWIAIAGLWANAIFWSVLMIDRSGAPATYDGYRYRHSAPAEWAFPTDDVATWAGAIAIEALVLSVLLRLATGSVTGICALFGVLCGFVALVMLPLGMHAPVTFSLHGAALLFAAGWLLLMSLVSAVVMLGVRDREAEEILAQAPPTARVVAGGRGGQRAP
jgi:hypothetical protein